MHHGSPRDLASSAVYSTINDHQHLNTGLASAVARRTVGISFEYRFIVIENYGHRQATDEVASRNTYRNSATVHRAGSR
jgi:hypothetical protein